MLDQPTEPPALPVPVPDDYDQRRVEEDFWPKLKRVAAEVPGVSDLLALYYYMNSDQAPFQHKVAVVATLAYFIMPVDALPDFFGALGYTDDLAVALGLIRFIGSEKMQPYRKYARRWLKGELSGEASQGGARGDPPREAPIDIELVKD